MNNVALSVFVEVESHIKYNPILHTIKISVLPLCYLLTMMQIWDF